LPLFSLAGIVKVSFSRGSEIFEHGRRKDLDGKYENRKLL